MTESLHGLRLSRFYNYEGVQYIPAPTGGWNPDANPWELPENQAPILDNFLIKPGRISMRGPVSALVSLGTNFMPIGYVIGDQATGSGLPSGWCSISRKARDATKQVDPWNAPLAAASAAQLAAGVTTLTQVNISSGSSGTVALTADTVIGPRWINFDGLLYGISYDAVAAAVHDTNSNYFMKPLNLLTLPYVQAAATVPTILANAPHGAFDLKGYLSRIWLLGGIDTPGGLAVHEPVTIFYTNPGTSGVGTAAADWKDPVSGLVNKIRMDNNNADYGVGLGLVSNAMVIFRRNSVWVLRGNTSASFQLQPLSKELGCIDARSIVETDHGIYFMSHRGLMLTDGTVITPTSGAVQSQLESVLGIVLSNIQAGQSSWVSCALTSQGHVLVSIGIGNSGAGGVLGALWSGLYDPATVSWTRITSQLWSAESAFNSPLPPLLVSRVGRQQLFSVGDKQFIQLENYSTSLTMGRSFLLNDGSSSGLYDMDASGVPFFDPIPAKWRTHFVTVIGSSSRRYAQGKRYIVDYLFGSNPVPSTTGWHVAPLDSSDTALDTAVDLPVLTTQGATNFNGESTALPRIQRANQDFTRELADMAFDVSWSQAAAAALPSWRADIYGIAIESQRTRDAR